MATPLPTFQKRMDQTKTGSYTMTAADAGLVTNVATTGGGATTITLPAGAAALAGCSFTIRNAGPNNGDTVITIAPNAADGVSGLGFTATTAKGPQQLVATAQVGDEITLTASGLIGNVAAWYITNASGTWSRLP